MSTSRIATVSVILVEDNVTLRRELVHYLSEEGFAVRGVGSGEELNLALKSGHADIAILDLNLGDEDGISITRRLRRALPGMGIVILTGRARSSDRLEGYASGADVYLTKPTQPAEIVAVVRNLFSRLKSLVPDDEWRLDVARLLLRSPSGADVALTGTEARMLKELSLRGHYMDHAAMTWEFGDPGLTEQVNQARVGVLVSRLRTKLRHHVADMSCINCLRGQGYQLGISLVLDNLAPRAVIPDPGRPRPL